MVSRITPKMFTDDGRSSFAYHLHNLHHNKNPVDFLCNYLGSKATILIIST